MAVNLIFNSNQYFQEAVEEAFVERKIKTFPYIKSYLVDILKHYLFVENLYDMEDSSGKKTRSTLAEMLLTAQQLGVQEKREKLKKLADSSLYISGFFSDSFQRKIIDIDYYVDMGKTAYSELSYNVDEDTFAQLYKEIARQFIPLVDVLSVISQRASMTDKENILRMMDVYAKTGSPLIEETLAEKGVFSSATKNQIKQ